MIPKIIHQTWKDKDVPEILSKIVEENKKLLVEKGYEFKLWTDEDIIKVIEVEYPFLLNAFQATMTGVQKGDIARLLLLHYMGGIYIDLDILILKDPDELLDMSQDKLYITYEPVAQTMRLYNKSDYLCNAFMAANAKNNMLNFMLQNINAIFLRNGAMIFQKFDIFGGNYVNAIYESYQNYQKDVCIIEERERVFPINDLKFIDLPSSKTDWDMIRYKTYHERVVMIHYWIHGDFESKQLLKNYQYDGSCDLQENMYKFFSILYPNNAKQLLQ